MDDTQRDKKLEFLQNQVKFMRGHFDTVIVFASHHDDTSGDTSYWVEGSGNFCARYGQVREWMLKQESEFKVR